MHFDSLDAAFQEVQAKYAEMSINNVRYEAKNLREKPSTINFNGLPIYYMWDVYRTSDGKLDISESENIGRYGYCEQDANPVQGEKEWVLYLNVS